MQHIDRLSKLKLPAIDLLGCSFSKSGIMFDCGVKKLFAMRSVLAGVTLCMFVLQGLALSGWPKFDSGAYGITQNADMHCGAQSAGDTPAPAHRHDHSDCCILCAASARDDFSFVALAVFSFVIYSASKSKAFTVRLSTEDSGGGRPTGWATSWSSRASPSLS